MIHPDCGELFPDTAHLFSRPSEPGQQCYNCHEASKRFSYGLGDKISSHAARQLHEYRWKRAIEANERFDEIKQRVKAQMAQVAGIGGAPKRTALNTAQLQEIESSLKGSKGEDIYEYNPEDEAIDF